MFLLVICIKYFIYTISTCCHVCNVQQQSIRRSTGDNNRVDNMLSCTQWSPVTIVLTLRAITIYSSIDAAATRFEITERTVDEVDMRREYIFIWRLAWLFFLLRPETPHTDGEFCFRVCETWS